ncbi:hypothetical protein ABZ769_03115 [Streptomyces olivoreticuli]
MTSDIAGWLAQAAVSPRTAVAHWHTSRAASLAVGKQWDLVRIDFTPATAAISHLKARDRHIGPYLMSGMEHAMWWPLPLGTGYRLAGTPGVTPYPCGAEILAPPPGKYLGDRIWVFPGHDGERWRSLTSTDHLHEALARKAAPCP